MRPHHGQVFHAHGLHFCALYAAMYERKTTRICQGSAVLKEHDGRTIGLELFSTPPEG